jgi:N-acetylmuramoyl-L-alanine amidase-like protein
MFNEEWEREVPSQAGIIDLTARTPTNQRHPRGRTRVDALVLHQMACCFQPRDPLQRFLSIVAHFAITADGRILQLHPTSALLWASNGFNHRSVAVEFAGNFPNTQGRWWQGDTFGRNQPTQRQVEAGRRLIRHLRSTIGITHVLAHRQSSGSRENDPGPDIWCNVGQWAVTNLGLSDGGPGYRIGSGNPIPDAWRTWNRPLTPEIGLEFEQELNEANPIVHDVASRCPTCGGGGGGG